MHKGHNRYNKRFKPFKFRFMLLNVDFKDFYWRRTQSKANLRLIYIISIVGFFLVRKNSNILHIIVVYVNEEAFGGE